MRFIFAPDSFKGSLSAMESCDILERVARSVFPGVETVSVPVADGGEGTVDALLRAMGGTRMKTGVSGPMFAPETAEWGLLPDGVTAVMEMAQASGLPYVPADRKDPRKATSLGTGEMIAAALKAGVRKILIGIGGSATNDGGIGMLTALGAVFLDADGRVLTINELGSLAREISRRNEAPSIITLGAEGYLVAYDGEMKRFIISACLLFSYLLHKIPEGGKNT